MIEVISGTNRPASNTLKIARAIEKMYHDIGAEARVLDLQDLPLELFHPRAYSEKPEGWSAITDRVVNASGLHVVTPEYNGGFPGVLKYFIDMLPFPQSFEHRCVAFTGNAGGIWGAFRAVEQLQMIFGYRNAYILPERVWLPQVNGRLDDSGQLQNDKDIELLNNQVRSFTEFIKHNCQS